MAFVSSPSSTNEVNTAYGVSTANTQVSPASTQVSTASAQVSTANLSDDTVYAFLSSQPNGSQLVHEDLKKIHEDDIEEMDLKWQLALLSMRTRRFFQKTSRKITINGSDTARYDKSKVECFNCHKMGHFARECRGPRNQDSRNRNQDSSRRTVNVEEISSKAMVAIDGAGFDWSYMADDEVPTNMDLMAFSDSEVHNDKTCLKSFETLKTQLDDLRIEFNKSEFNLATYKRGLASVEQLVFYKNNEKSLSKKKKIINLKIEIFDNASKSLDKLIGSQIADKSRKGVGFISYNAVPPPPTGLFSPLKFDLSNSDLEEFQQLEFEGYGPKPSKSFSEDTSNEFRESPDAPLIEELVSDDKLEKKSVFPTVAKIGFVRPKQQEKPVRKPVKYAEMYRLTAITMKGKGWNLGIIIQGPKAVNTARPNSAVVNVGHPQKEDQGYVDSGCSRPMTGNMSYFSDFKEFDRGYVTFGGEPKEGKLLVLLKVPRKNNMYSVDMKNIVPKESLTCLVAKATLDESMLWHRRLGHVNFKTVNKLVKENLVRGLPSKRFENDQTCVACLKGKQHKASYVTMEQSLRIELCVIFVNRKVLRGNFSVARTPQQNGVAERRNRTLIEAARTMLADSKLPTTFWAEAVNTACYVQNRVLVVKPHNKTPYELFRGRTPALSFMRPFGCHVTILNTLDYLGKFDGKSDEGFFVGYSMNSKAFRVYNIRTRKVEENLHIRFLEDKPIIAGDGPKWLFDIDVLTKSMNYVPVVAGTNSNDFEDGSLFDSSSKNASNDEPQPSSDAEKKDDEGVCKESGISDQKKPENSTQGVNTTGPSINTEPDMFSLGDNATLKAIHADFFGDETEVDMSNITTTYPVPSTPNTRIHKDHSLDHVIGDVQSGVLTRRMTKTTNEQGFISAVYERKTHEDLHTCLFACFLSQVEPKKKVWTLVDLPYGKRAIWTKWVYRNKKDERGIIVRNKARLVAQGYTQEEGIDYDEFFAPVARIKSIRLFLAYASFMNFVVYQMDMKSAFLYGKIKEEVYVCQPPGFEDPEFPDRVYKVEKALYGLHQAPRACIIEAFPRESPTSHHDLYWNIIAVFGDVEGMDMCSSGQGSRLREIINDRMLSRDIVKLSAAVTCCAAYLDSFTETCSSV
ncbi:putative ribonuclease H-like domain-containing protein [Tanacetum coccineum]